MVRFAVLLAFSRFLTGLSLYNIVSSLILESRGLDYTGIFALESVLAIALFLLEVPSGVWADSFDRRNILIIGNLCSLLAAGLFAVSTSFWMFAVSFPLSGVGIAFLSGTESAYVYDVLVQQGRTAKSTRVFGWLEATEKAALLVALPAGSIVATYGLTAPVYATVAASAIGVALLWTLPPQRVKQHEGKGTGREPGGAVSRAPAMVWEGIRLILRTPTLVFLALSGPAVWVLVNAINYLNQPLFREARVPLANFGWVMMGAQVVAILGSMAAGRVERKLGTIGTVVASSAVMSLSYLGLAFSRDLVTMALLIGVIIGGLSVRAPVMGTAVNALVPSRIRATVLSLLNAAGTVLTVALNPLIGHLADRALSGAFVFCGISILLLTFVYHPTLVRLHTAHNACEQPARDLRG